VGGVQWRISKKVRGERLEVREPVEARAQSELLSPLRHFDKEQETRNKKEESQRRLFPCGFLSLLSSLFLVSCSVFKRFQEPGSRLALPPESAL